MVSVRLSVTLVCTDHMVWNYLEIITRKFIARVFATGWQRSTDLLQEDHSEIPVGIGVRYGKNCTTWTDVKHFRQWLVLSAYVSYVYM